MARYTDTRRAFEFFTLRVKNPQLGLQYVFDSRSPEPLSQRGVLASVDLSGSGEFLGGDLRYARMFSQLNLHRPAGRLMGRGLTWSQSFRLGLAEAFDQELIRDVRFFAGGEYSVRGYATESLGEHSSYRRGHRTDRRRGAAGAQPGAQLAALRRLRAGPVLSMPATCGRTPATWAAIC